jgi:hypothetical protein
MLFSDGECPHCAHHQLFLNQDDLIECPQCHLVCSDVDGLLAAVMPFLGTAQCPPANALPYGMQGMAFAQSKANSVLADETKIFNNQQELRHFVGQLGARTSSADS